MRCKRSAFFNKMVSVGLAVSFWMSNANAVISPVADDETLIVGCRPWDSNIQEIDSSKRNACHYLDFMTHGGPDTLPHTFHHVDINDNGTFYGAKLSDFSKENPEKFSRIIIDWMTYQHIRRDNAFSDFAELLKPGGQLFVPVTSMTLSPQKIVSDQKAQELIANKNLGAFFSQVNTLSYDDLPEDLNLLKRGEKNPESITQSALEMKPSIIVATK